MESTRELLRSPAGEGVTAILAATDSTAMGALRALHDAKRVVPDEIALISFGGTFTADYLNPPLTTMTLPMRELGRRAARLLLSRIEGDTSPFQHLILPTELVVRGSSGPVRP
jgi:DNA-binding LacI/PurR family transcriptional regulator